MAKILEGLIGEGNVIRKSGDDEETVPLSSLFGRDKIIGLYFSAHWCPPCRTFTPLLTEFYNKLKEKNGDLKFEIIFVSWDKEETIYKEYFSSMPWLALPFDPDSDCHDKKRKKKGKLAKKYRVQSIPKLVLLDGETGKTITTDGYACLMDDKEGREFPWRKKKFSEIAHGKLINNKNEEFDSSEILKGKFIGLYFSAHWCPPCRAFTPELMKVYEALKSKDKNMEVVFVTSDRSQESFDKYFETMPWFAIPFGDPRLEKLKMLYGVDGIPMLVMLDADGEVVTFNGRAAVTLDKEGQEFPWYPKPVNPLTEDAAVVLNEAPCLVLFTGEEDKDTELAEQTLIDIAREEHQKGEDQELFFFYGPDSEFCDTVKDFANLEDQVPLLVILDLPEQKVYICQETNITKDTASNFVKQYFAETLEPTLLT